MRVIFNVIGSCSMSVLVLLFACEANEQKTDEKVSESELSENSMVSIEGNQDTLGVANELMTPTNITDNESKKEGEPIPSSLNPNDWEQLTWMDLKDVTFTDVYYEEADGYFMTPTFGQEIKKWAGKSIYISGYVIPISDSIYVLSANPFSACFFCGNAGPESIMELQFTEYPRQFFTDEWVTFKGEFGINKDDIDHLNYILKGAEEYQEYQRTLGSK